MKRLLKRISLISLQIGWFVLSLLFFCGVINVFGLLGKSLEPKRPGFYPGNQGMYLPALQAMVALSALVVPLWAYYQFVRLGFFFSNKIENCWFRVVVAELPATACELNDSDPEMKHIAEASKKARKNWEKENPY